MTIIIYCDGGSLGNPGPAAIGAVIKDKKENLLKKYGKEIGVKTNNQAEYEAIIFGLKKAKQIFGGEKIKKMTIEIRSDSELIINQLNGKFKIKEKDLIPLFIEIWNLKTALGNVVFKQIPREQSEEAHNALSEALTQNKKNASLF
ncbi:MAG: hypothetical protein A3H02_01705 [Candidatus Niyogibacteria bacterium RIFCSPLOWO2_12_FULL_41_13]|uniref:RNase H type-1 domain-containing protein n=1 Tax=Candidatus Niyogibacteria bacterium RIFCSPLOWO2_12_FULL_41_13 TaxID=1801726 RepID=A0A1G2F2H0_9BACT|nr:MAG: hypothetical protein A3H02_01705 [Candidatus Niyogibacteria bacterium RIFCSPLOWO2_12_FULL_41_13]